MTSNYYQYKLKVHNFKGIIIGPQFLSFFKYVLLDYDKKQIEFYSNTTIITSFYNSNKAIILYIIEYILMIVNFVLLLVSKLNIIYN